MSAEVDKFLRNEMNRDFLENALCDQDDFITNVLIEKEEIKLENSLYDSPIYEKQ